MQDSCLKCQEACCRTCLNKENISTFEFTTTVKCKVYNHVNLPDRGYPVIDGTLVRECLMYGRRTQWN